MGVCPLQCLRQWEWCLLGGGQPKHIWELRSTHLEEVEWKQSSTTQLNLGFKCGWEPGLTHKPQPWRPVRPGAWDYLYGINEMGAQFCPADRSKVQVWVGACSTHKHQPWRPIQPGTQVEEEKRHPRRGSTRGQLKWEPVSTQQVDLFFNFWWYLTYNCKENLGEGSSTRSQVYLLYWPKLWS